MNNNNMPEMLGKIWALLKKNKYVMAVLLVGLVLILLPTGASNADNNSKTTPEARTEFSLSEQEVRIAAALSKIEGAGKVTVVLTLKCTSEQVLAKNENEATSSREKADSPEYSDEWTSTVVIISAGNSMETPVTLKYIYPEYLGALVICEGADNAAVRIQLVRAVSGLTGLGTNKVIVTKMNKT